MAAPMLARPHMVATLNRQAQWLGWAGCDLVHGSSCNHPPFGGAQRRAIVCKIGTSWPCTTHVRGQPAPAMPLIQGGSAAPCAGPASYLHLCLGPLVFPLRQPATSHCGRGSIACRGPGARLARCGMHCKMQGHSQPLPLVPALLPAAAARALRPAAGPAAPPDSGLPREGESQALVPRAEGRRGGARGPPMPLHSSAGRSAAAPQPSSSGSVIVSARACILARGPPSPPHTPSTTSAQSENS
jgi:hypothetical protein